MSANMVQDFVIHSLPTGHNVHGVGPHPHFDASRFGTVDPERHSQANTPDKDDSRSADSNRLDGLLTLISDMLHCPDTSQAKRVAADWIRNRLDASYVMISDIDDGLTIKETMQSGLPAAAEMMELRDSIHAAMQETVLTCRVHRGRTTDAVDTYSPGDCGYAVQRLGDQLHGCIAFTAIPLLTNLGTCVGAVFIGWSQEPDQADPDEAEIAIQQWSAAIADVMEAQQRLDLRLLTRLKGAIQSHLPVQRWQLAVGSGLLLIAIALIPTAYPVRAKVSAEPDSRRWITAPFDASLKKSHVVPGQKVVIGQLLYSIDCQELLNKLATLRAEADKYAAERATQLSAGRLADAAVSGASLKRTQCEIDLIHRYLDRAEVRSPVDGVVMGQDLQRLEGAPLNQGQTLIEIAPIDALHLRVEIPTDLISHVVIGNDASVSIESIGSLGSAKLSRFQPRAEANEQGRYVFEGRIDLAEQVTGLMPGMSGYATLYGERQPFAWCLVQRLWQQLRSWSDQV